jgi:hypothetical protein
MHPIAIKHLFRDDLPQDGADIGALPIGLREQNEELAATRLLI